MRKEPTGPRSSARVYAYGVSYRDNDTEQTERGVFHTQLPVMSQGEVQGKLDMAGANVTVLRYWRIR